MSINYLWGNSAWTFLHYITFNYPINPSDNEKKNYKKLFKNLKYTLPCDECKIHYKKMIKFFPIDIYLENRWSLIWWLFTIHSIINERLYKKIVYDFNDLLKIYNNFKCNKCSLVNTDVDNHLTNNEIKEYIKKNLYNDFISKYKKYMKAIKNKIN
jgi:hypothetical protein